MAAAQAARRAQADENAMITPSRRSLLEHALTAAQAAAASSVGAGELWTRAIPRLMAATSGGVARSAAAADGIPRLVQPAAVAMRPAVRHWSDGVGGTAVTAAVQPLASGGRDPLLTHVVNPFRASSQEHTLAQRLTLASITAAAAAAKKMGVVVETLAAVLPRE